MSVRRCGIALASFAMAGCGGSLSRPDAGTGPDAAVAVDLLRQLDAAGATWAAAKSTCAVYAYERPVYNGFGIGPWTDVEIQNDVPTRRRYWWRVATDAGTGWMLGWDEVGSQVGSHTGDSTVFPASTVEQLQAECEAVLSRDPAANWLTLTVDSHGVPTTCTYFPMGCADACQVGIKLTSFTCAPLSDDAGPRFF